MCDWRVCYILIDLLYYINYFPHYVILLIEKNSIAYFTNSKKISIIVMVKHVWKLSICWLEHLNCWLNYMSDGRFLPVTKSRPCDSSMAIFPSPEQKLVHSWLTSSVSNLTIINPISHFYRFPLFFLFQTHFLLRIRFSCCSIFPDFADLLLGTFVSNARKNSFTQTMSTFNRIRNLQRWEQSFLFFPCLMEYNN